MNSMISTIVAEHVAPLLKSCGFKKRANHWNRRRDDFVDVATLQEASYSTDEKTVFTMNLGVAVPAFVEAVWSTKFAGFATEAECSIRIRLGDLQQGKIYGDANDQWWTIENRDSCESVGNEVATAIKDYAIPFFDSFDDYESIAGHLRKSHGWISRSPFHVICLALAEARCGRTTEALDQLKFVQGKAWKAKISNLQEIILAAASQGNGMDG